MAQLGIFPMTHQMAGVFAVSSAACFFALISVLLRLYSRCISKAGFGWDDGFILVSVACGISLLTIEGLSKEPDQLSSQTPSKRTCSLDTNNFLPVCTSGIGYPTAEVKENLPLLITVRLLPGHEGIYVL